MASHPGVAGTVRDGARAAVLRVDPTQPLVSDLLVEFEAMKRAADVGDDHRENVLLRVREAVADCGWVWPSQMTSASVVEYLNRRKAKGNGPKYRNHIRDCLRQFGAWLVAKGLIDKNPVDKLLVPKAQMVRRQARYVPTEVEVVRLIVATASSLRKGDRWLVYVLAASTGLRTATIKYLTPDMVHLERMGEGLAWLEIPATILVGRRTVRMLKNGESGRIWLTRECAERLRVHMERHAGPYVFDKVPKLKHFDCDLARAGLEKAKRPGAPTFSRHSLRHFHAMRLDSISVFDLDERQQAMTHKTAAMTEHVYQHREHENFGRKVWRLKPLLPDDFRPIRGSRKNDPGPKNGKNVLDKGDLTDHTDVATYRDSNGHQPAQSKNGPLGSNPRCASLPAEPLVRGSVSALCVCAEQPNQASVSALGVIGSNPRSPVQTVCDPEILGAYKAVVEAQANLIRLLQKESPDATSSGS